MSRSNLFKKKRRSVNKTVLFFAEGLDESSFLKYLKSLYSSRKIAVTIKKGKGGSADGIVIGATNIIGSFGKRAVVIDNDKPKREMQAAQAHAKGNNIILILHTPCLEANLLKILQKGRDYSSKPSKWCKKEFETKYIDGKDREEMSSYSRHFPKKLLDECRQNIPELDLIIRLIGGEN
jgi:hypothetical protein